jgi:hypothetical protein
MKYLYEKKVLNFNTDYVTKTLELKNVYWIVNCTAHLQIYIKVKILQRKQYYHSITGINYATH